MATRKDMYVPGEEKRLFDRHVELGSMFVHRCHCGLVRVRVSAVFYAPCPPQFASFLPLSESYPPNAFSVSIPESKVSLAESVSAGAVVEDAPRRLSRRCISA